MAAETKKSMADYLNHLAGRLLTDPGYSKHDLIEDLQETIEEWAEDALEED